MRAELAEAVSSGLPTVVAIRQPLVGEWEKFLGEPGHLLQPEPTDIVNWSRQWVRPADTISPAHLESSRQRSIPTEHVLGDLEVADHADP